MFGVDERPASNSLFRPSHHWKLSEASSLSRVAPQAPARRAPRDEVAVGLPDPDTHTLAWGFFLEKSQASPRSEILTWPCSSKRMFAG